MTLGDARRRIGVQYKEFEGMWDTRVDEQEPPRNERIAIEAAQKRQQIRAQREAEELAQLLLQQTLELIAAKIDEAIGLELVVWVSYKTMNDAKRHFRLQLQYKSAVFRYGRVSVDVRKQGRYPSTGLLLRCFGRIDSSWSHTILPGILSSQSTIVPTKGRRRHLAPPLLLRIIQSLSRYWTRTRTQRTRRLHTGLLFQLL
ncbi:hypothetical protein BDV95DRAFT_6319 [Massariosphaeria phaeospora]|uniref:Uncharacterized protein n=1 Tax=Massariosphaeria phaeospora TaxID=100035 RepID=A0A7C8IF74_9PLEO|nr:hypothetical protein BDV95DRAFT_6319 [Massariosphaeria phaeospora]